MRRPNDLRNRLRESTREEHLRIDGLLSSLNLATRQDYVRFLRIHAEALRQLGSRTPPQDRADTAALASCLESDLKFYVARPLPQPMAECEEPLARQLGIAYVIRGSRLGAQVLIQRVAAGAPCAYLRYRAATSWTAFLATLDSFSLTQSPDSEGDVIEGAKAAFGVFFRVAESAAHWAP
jgi:heme oxygenase (biliverdin-IX-beta and delta-forming)